MRGRRSACHRRRPKAGFTLVEVLVAMFVVALGVAGAAAVQAVAVRAADEAARLSDGLRLADSLAQRMRANPVAMALPDGANPYLQADIGAGAAAAPAASCYGSAVCDPMQMASFDLSETAMLLADRFPGGRLRVCRDAPAPDAAGLLAWDCTGAPGAPVVVKLGWRGRPDEPDAPAVFLALGTGAP
jgi:type IV pilus assembly protein PilV